MWPALLLSAKQQMATVRRQISIKQQTPIFLQASNRKHAIGCFGWRKASLVLRIGDSHMPSLNVALFLFINYTQINDTQNRLKSFKQLDFSQSVRFKKAFFSNSRLFDKISQREEKRREAARVFVYFFIHLYNSSSLTSAELQYINVGFQSITMSG